MRPLRPTRHAPDDYPFAVGIRARFAETDAMGVVHHAAYLPYLESARVEYLRALGHPYAALREEGVDLAVIGVDVSYLAPLRFDDVFDVHVGLAHVAGAAVGGGYQIEVEGRALVHGITRPAARNPIAAKTCVSMLAMPKPDGDHNVAKYAG